MPPQELGSILLMIAIAVMLMAVFSAGAFARPAVWRGSGAAAALGAAYDPKTIETVSGEIAALGDSMLRLQLEHGSAQEVIAVHLGPSWYLARQATKLALKDKVEVRGSRTVFDGKPAIIAAEVRRGDATLKLRDAMGCPYWERLRRPGVT